MTLTMMPYLDKLKPVQQDYIVWCVREFSLKPYGPDFHRGLLPFLAAEEAAWYLECRKQQIASAYGFVSSVGATSTLDTLKGTRFIESILDVFRFDLPRAPGANQVIWLSDEKLRKANRRRYAVKMTMKLPALKNELVQLERISKNNWKVTAYRNLLPQALTILSDQYA